MSDSYKSTLHHTSRHKRPGASREKEKGTNALNNLLAYYESSAADSTHTRTPASTDNASPVLVPRPHRQRTLSAASSSSSDYSEASDSVDEPFSDLDHASVASSSTKKRSTVPSQGGADRRRLAIVQMETLQEAMASDTASSASSSIRSRRGLSSQLAGIALVAPPDASSRTYTNLTPPSTVTLAAGTEEKGAQVLPSPRSERASPRDAEPKTSTPRNKDKETPTIAMGRPTIFNVPSSVPSPPTPRSPLLYEDQRAMLSPVSAMDRHALSSATPSPLITPEIGASKDIHTPVAAPVVVDLASKKAVQSRQNTSAQRSVAQATVARTDTTATSKPRTPFDRAETSGFVHYQPGLHATAGPLPPPPRLFDLELRTPPPPRPPRLHSPAPPKMKKDLEAVKQALQLPPHVAAKLAKTSTDIKPAAVTSSKREDSSQDSVLDSSTTTLSTTVSSHRREGASVSPLVQTAELAPSAPPSRFATSTLGLEEDGQPAKPSSVVDDDDDVPEVVIEEEAPPPPSTEDEPSVTAETAGHLNTEEASSLKASTSTSSSVSSAYPKPRSMKGDRSSWKSVKSLQQRSPSPQSSVSGGGGGHHHHRRVLSDDEDTRSSMKRLSRSISLSPRSSQGAPSPPPKSFRNSLSTNLKRFSSTRAPSIAASVVSAQSASYRASSDTHSSRTPSPSPHHHRNGRRRILDFNPPAMFCHEVYQQRTTAERCAIYAAKINELYIYDCGLSDWVIEMRYRTAHPPPRGPSAQSFSPKPRMTSGASMVSEATFPRRPDASVATDLSQQNNSSAFCGSLDPASPISVPVSLPYQTLADRQRQQSIRSSSSNGHGSTSPPSVRSLAAPSSLGHPTKTGFFASLGRKASIQTNSRRGSGLTPAHSNGSSASAARSGSNVLAKPAPSKQDISKPILISSNHSAPSGPRAPPTTTTSMRVQRSQTLMTTVSPSAFPIDKDVAIGRRPSLFNIPSSTEAGANQQAPGPYVVNADFEEQVNKLQNLLPHADRGVLAGYLRRSGQDVMAIGQYLEDEKNGTLKYF